MGSQTQLVIIFAVIFAGYYLFWRIAKANIQPWNFKAFFLGNANIGTDLTENNTLGITFAWSGGTWYFAWLAYQYGPWVIVSQIFWCASIICLALLLPKIITQISNKTIHGFLRDRYGDSTQRAAAIATTIGYFVNAGFELFWSSLLLARCLNREDLSLPVALVFAILVGTYCAVGGYKSNATIDKAQNLFGVLSLAGLVWLVSTAIHIPSSFALAAQLFLGGAIIYTVVSLLLYFKPLRRFPRVQNGMAALYALAAFAIAYLIIVPTHSGAHLASFPVTNAPVPLWVIIGTVTFQIFFNVIDMQNWQEIAANGDAPPAQYKFLSWAIVRASLYLLWFPALGGVLLGYLLKVLSAQVTDQNLFTYAFAQVLPHTDILLRALILGLLFLGFISTSLSTVGDLLMSALQTVSFDIVWPKRIQQLMARAPSEASTGEQRKLVLKARTWLIPMAVIMVVTFWGLWKLYPGPVFNFQAMMYAAPLALLAPVLIALLLPRVAKYLSGTVTFTAIVASVAAIVIMFVVSAIPGMSDPVVNWTLSFMPLAANLISWGICIVGVLLAMTRDRNRAIDTASVG